MEQAEVLVPEWFTDGDISKPCAYQILRSEQIPRLDILLRTALSLYLNLEEIQRLLLSTRNILNRGVSL